MTRPTTPVVLRLRATLHSSAALTFETGIKKENLYAFSEEVKDCQLYPIALQISATWSTTAANVLDRASGETRLMLNTYLSIGQLDELIY